jgi:hypothetical protein
MGTSFPAMTTDHRAFIERQHVFFIATAAAGPHINVSPKPTRALRIRDERTVAYLDLTGSGNETAAHLAVDGRITLMFCAFAGPPLILRLYGSGTVLLRGTDAYAAALADAFEGIEPAGARQIITIDVTDVRTSCGYGVPLYTHVADRDQLERWAQTKDDAALRDYRRQKNAVSLDGLPISVPEA